MRKLLLLLGLIFCKTIFSQPIILAKDLNPKVGQFHYYVNIIDTLPQPDEGGKNKVWDYSYLKYSDSLKRKASIFKSSEYAGFKEFPESNLACIYDYDTTQIHFISISDSAYLNLGDYYIDKKNFLKNYPYYTYINYPLTYQKVSKTSCSTFVSFYKKDIEMIYETTAIVDGFGTLKLPKATHTNVLRLKNITTSYRHNLLTNQKEKLLTSTTYTFFKAGLRYKILSIRETTDGKWKANLSL